MVKHPAINIHICTHRHRPISSYPSSPLVSTSVAQCITALVSTSVAQTFSNGVANESNPTAEQENGSESSTESYGSHESHEGYEGDEGTSTYLQVLGKDVVSDRPQWMATSRY